MKNRISASPSGIIALKRLVCSHHDGNQRKKFVATGRVLWIEMNLRYIQPGSLMARWCYRGNAKMTTKKVTQRRWPSSPVLPVNTFNQGRRHQESSSRKPGERCEGRWDPGGRAQIILRSGLGTPAMPPDISWKGLVITGIANKQAKSK